MMKYFWLGFLILLPVTGATQATNKLQWFQPDAIMHGWWDEVLNDCKCQASIPWEGVTWFTIPEATFACASDRCFGAFYAEPPTIVLVAWGQHRKWLVQHEMLHAILGTGEHDGAIWRHYSP